jgi:hypothetical protein
MFVAVTNIEFVLRVLRRNKIMISYLIEDHLPKEKEKKNERHKRSP